MVADTLGCCGSCRAALGPATKSRGGNPEVRPALKIQVAVERCRAPSSQARDRASAGQAAPAEALPAVSAKMTESEGSTALATRRVFVQESAPDTGSAQKRAGKLPFASGPPPYARGGIERDILGGALASDTVCETRAPGHSAAPALREKTRERSPSVLHQWCLG